ncbi:MAG: hypothetical protein H6807_11485 [Planctomycetes bacterium]|nr:hypothetical protein [Planctomycetota bacterium]
MFLEQPVQAIFLSLQRATRITDRLAGLQERMDDGGAANQRFLIPVLVTLGLGLVSLVALRAWRWKKFRACMGERGFGLDRKLLQPLWKALDPESRLDPSRLIRSRELIGALLEQLASRDRGLLRREFLRHVIGQNEDLRHPREGMAQVAQLERLRLHREDGFILEGFVRRVGQHAIDFVALDTPMQLPFQDEMLQIERANGEHLQGRVLRITGLHGPWTIGIGEAAVHGHRRQEFRVTLDAEGLAFAASPRLEKIRLAIIAPEEPVHFLIAKQKAENPDTYESLLARGQHFASAQPFRFDDLSALGARIRMVKPPFKLKVDSQIYLYLPFEIDERREDHLVSAEVVEIWEESLDGSQTDVVLRCRFFDIQEEELRRMRILVNQVAATKDRFRSVAPDLLEQYRRRPARVR